MSIRKFYEWLMKLIMETLNWLTCVPLSQRTMKSRCEKGQQPRHSLSDPALTKRTMSWSELLAILNENFVQSPLVFLLWKKKLEISFGSGNLLFYLSLRKKKDTVSKTCNNGNVNQGFSVSLPSEFAFYWFLICPSQRSAVGSIPMPIRREQILRELIKIDEGLYRSMPGLAWIYDCLESGPESRARELNNPSLTFDNSRSSSMDQFWKFRDFQKCKIHNIFRQLQIIIQKYVTFFFSSTYRYRNILIWIILILSFLNKLSENRTIYL